MPSSYLFWVFHHFCFSLRTTLHQTEEGRCVVVLSTLKRFLSQWHLILWSVPVILKSIDRPPLDCSRTRFNSKRILELMRNWNECLNYMWISNFQFIIYWTKNSRRILKHKIYVLEEQFKIQNRTTWSFIKNGSVADENGHADRRTNLIFCPHIRKYTKTHRNGLASVHLSISLVVPERLLEGFNYCWSRRNLPYHRNVFLQIPSFCPRKQHLTETNSEINKQQTWNLQAVKNT